MKKRSDTSRINWLIANKRAVIPIGDEWALPTRLSGKMQKDWRASVDEAMDNEEGIPNG